MSERLIHIEPYPTYNDLILLGGKVSVPDLNLEIDIPGNKSLNLYNYEYDDSIQIVPRNHETIVLKINISWRKDFQISSLSNLLGEYENPTEVLAFRLQVTCNKSRWCSEQKKIDLSNINKRASLSFEIPLSEVKGILLVQGFITRENIAKKIRFDLPEAPLAILSTCKELSIQIDELKDIGGEYLPILPGHTGELAFDITGLENQFELPRILYAEELKEYLTRDNLPSVTSSIITGMFYFLDQYLKWLIFICRVDINDKYHNSLIDLFSRYAAMPKDEIINLIEKDKYCEDQIRGYLKLSNDIFKGVQIQNKYKRELKNIYKSNTK